MRLSRFLPRRLRRYLQPPPADPAARPYRLEQIPRHAPVNPLTAHRTNVYSQDGEDSVLARIFEILPPRHRYCVEFGALDGEILSNCCNLIRHADWSGCFIEAHAARFRTLLDKHGKNPRVTCVQRYIALEGPNTLDNVLAEAGAPADLDLISIDIDGLDWFVWRSLARHAPRVVVIEFNPSIPNDVIFVQAPDARVNQGCSLAALVELGREKGYALIACTGWNAFFVREEDFPRFGIQNNDIDTLYRPMMDGRIFHGYDGRLFITGMPRLIWSKVQVDMEKIQLLSPEERGQRDGPSASERM
jgi:hypothetical protein